VIADYWNIMLFCKNREHTMKRILLGCWIFLIIGIANAENNANTLVDGKLIKVSSGHKFTEGPAANKNGDVYFSDIPNQKIHRISTDGKVTLHRDHSNKSNGLFFSASGDLLACESKTRQVTAQAANGEISILADRYQGKKLNSPNDLWVDKWGGIYFTDPRYGSTKNIEQDGFHVYYIAADKTIQRVISDLKRPNGIVGTADNTKLYVADADAGKIFVYTIEGAGKITGKRLFCDLGSDGMTLDSAGRLYLTTDAVKIFNPDGSALGEINVPETPTNVVFGGTDFKTLFITTPTSVYSVKMKIKGNGR
jgi:gluconolactonase